MIGYKVQHQRIGITYQILGYLAGILLVWFFFQNLGDYYRPAALRTTLSYLIALVSLPVAGLYYYGVWLYPSVVTMVLTLVAACLMGFGFLVAENLGQLAGFWGISWLSTWSGLHTLA